MKKHSVVGIIFAAACLLGAGASAFPQTPAKSPKDLQKHKQPNPIAKRGSTAPTALYIVKKGDTLYAVAGAYGTTVAALKSVNHLRTTRLQIGQRLRLSACPTGKPDSNRPMPVADPLASSVIAKDKSPAEGIVTLESAALEGREAPDIEGSPGSQAEPTEQPLRLRLASTGIEFLGVRYRSNGSSERSGFDCSGLVKRLFEKFNISLPRSSREQFKMGEKIDKNKLEVGDLVFFSSRGKIPSHVGIYIGDNKFLHAARRARKVLISNLTAAWYSKRFLGARRLSDLWDPEPKPAETKSN